MSFESDILTDEDLVKLKDLGNRISASLDCDINGYGVPCRTDRLAVVNLMKKYLEIHDYKVSQK